MWPGLQFVAANMVHMFQLMLSSPVFWFCLMMVPTITLMADVVYKAVKTTVFMNETEKIRIAEVCFQSKQNHTTQVSTHASKCIVKMNIAFGFCIKSCMYCMHENNIVNQNTFGNVYLPLST